MVSGDPTKPSPEFEADYVDCDCSECDHHMYTPIPRDRGRQVNRLVSCAECGHHNYMRFPQDFVERDRHPDASGGVHT